MACRELRLVLALTLLAGCAKLRDQRQLRQQWVAAQTEQSHFYLWPYLNGSPQVDFYDGWYPAEHDPKSGGAWRWMKGRAIVRLNMGPPVSDIELTVHGWGAPRQYLGVRTQHMRFAIDGHELDRFEPPDHAFVHSFVVPRALLERGQPVDLSIWVANTARPAGDWRDLGFATTGITWKPTSSPP